MAYEGDKKREYQRQWVAARRAEWLSDKSCAVCGATNDLQIDHINAKDKVTHRIWSLSWKRIEDELAKCQVLCKFHHQIKTIDNEIKQHYGYVHMHGTNAMYNKHGCRCNLCSDANAKKQKRRRKRLRDQHGKYMN